VNPNWPLQEKFKEQCRLTAEREGFITKRGAIDIPALAKFLEMGATTLKQNLDNKRRKEPSLQTFRDCSKKFQCDISVLVSNGIPIWIEEEEWNGLEEERKLAYECLYQYVKTAPVEDLPGIVSMVKTAQEMGRRRENAEGKRT
jgi:hypothetical protein